MFVSPSYFVSCFVIICFNKIWVFETTAPETLSQACFLLVWSCTGHIKTVCRHIRSMYEANTLLRCLRAVSADNSVIVCVPTVFWMMYVQRGCSFIVFLANPPDPRDEAASRHFLEFILRNWVPQWPPRKHSNHQHTVRRNAHYRNRRPLPSLRKGSYRRHTIPGQVAHTRTRLHRVYFFIFFL